MSIRYSQHASRRKVALAITDARPTARPEIVEVVLLQTGKPMRMRRDMVEFWPGRVVMPYWLADKVLKRHR
jgi:hypothetical protein